MDETLEFFLKDMQRYEEGGIGKLPRSKVLRVMDKDSDQIVELRTQKDEMRSLYKKVSQNGNLTQH